MREKALEFQKNYFSSTTGSVQECYDKLTKFIENLINDHVPSKYSSNRNRVPWMSPHIRRLVRKKQRIYNKARKSKSPTDWKHYRTVQKQVVLALKNSRENYINNIIKGSLEKNDTKPFWRYIKSQKNDNCGVAPLKSKQNLNLKIQMLTGKEDKTFFERFFKNLSSLVFC